MKTELTTTTGTVKGASPVSAFIKECYSKYDAVFIVQMGGTGDVDYLQYTLLTENRIRLYLSSILAEKVPYRTTNNWHVVEEGQMRSPWNSYEDAKEFYDRLCRHFPDVTFELLQLDTLSGSGLRDENGAFYE